MDFSKHEDECWFIQLKDNRKDFYSVDNLIESAKAKYERNNRVYEWTAGSALAIVFSLSIGDVLKNPNPLIAFSAAIAYGVCLTAILVSMFLYQKANKIYEVALIWLYREKDEQDRQNKKAGKND